MGTRITLNTDTFYAVAKTLSKAMSFKKQKNGMLTSSGDFGTFLQSEERYLTIEQDAHLYDTDDTDDTDGTDAVDIPNE